MEVSIEILAAVNEELRKAKHRIEELEYENQGLLKQNAEYQLKLNNSVAEAYANDNKQQETIRLQRVVIEEQDSIIDGAIEEINEWKEKAEKLEEELKAIDPQWVPNYDCFREINE